MHVTCSQYAGSIPHASVSPESKEKSKGPRRLAEPGGLTAAAYYSRELDQYPIMTHEEQDTLGKSISLHRDAVRKLADSMLLIIRRQPVPADLLSPIRVLSESQGFSVEELEQASHAIPTLLTYIPEELHPSLRSIQTNLESPRAQYASMIDQMVSGNLRLVQKLVPTYLYEGTTREDLTQDGNIGLMKAAERFDPRAKTMFSTYATYWIKQALQRSLNTARAMYYPMEHLDNQRHLKKAHQELQQQLERPPTQEELATFLNWSVDKVSDHQAHSITSVSLDELAYNGDADNQTVLDTLSNPHTLNPETLYEQEQTATLVHDLLSVLTDVEQQVVKHHVGLDDHDLSVTELSEKLGVTRDKLRRIHTKALAKLRTTLLARGYERTAFSLFDTGRLTA